MHKVQVTFDLATWFLFFWVFLKPTMHDKVMSWTQTDFAEAYAQSADSDLDLYPSNMVSVCNDSSCHDDYLCQIIY